MPKPSVWWWDGMGREMVWGGLGWEMQQEGDDKIHTPTNYSTVPHSWQRCGIEEYHGFSSNERWPDLMHSISTPRSAKNDWWKPGQPSMTSHEGAMAIEAAESMRLHA
jgi:hypothetical protein